MSRSFKEITHRTSFKFTLFTLVAVLGIGTLAGTLLWKEYGALLQERQKSTKAAVDLAYRSLDYYHALEQSGALTREQAQKQALDVVRDMRYAGKEYFWVNDMHPSMVMHPIKPEMDGDDLSQMTDANGFKLYNDFVKVVSESPTHDGFVYYVWPKPGMTEPVKKLSYVKEFAPWGWVIGTGVYIDDVKATVWQQAGGAGVAAGVMALLLIVIGLFLSRRLVRQLGAEPDAVIGIANRIAGGDLRMEVPVRPEDRASLLRAMANMRTGIAEAVAKVRQGSEQIAFTVEDLVTSNHELSARTEQQAASLQETAASMEEITSTVGNNSSNAQQANELVASATQVAKRGGEVTAQVVATMGEVNATTSQMSDIIGTIDGIAFQTNILALNASVEAARAGEQGKGFAVVASEVRALAQRSAAAAREIRELIDNTIVKIHTSTTQADSAGQTMSEIVTSVEKVASIMSEITLAGREQASGIEQINQAIGEMDKVTQQNASMVEKSSASAQSLNEQMRGLNQAVGVFQLRDSAPRLPAHVAAALKAPARSRRDDSLATS